MFIEELQNNSYKINSKGGLYYGTTFNANLDVFTMVNRFTDDEELIKLFNKAYRENKDLLAANILYNLDIRNGKGERNVFKVLFHQMCLLDKKLAKIILSQIPSLGRFDYVFESYNTPIWEDAFLMVKKQLEQDLTSDNPSLLAKWMPSLRTHNKNNPFAKKLANELGLSEKEYRKTLSTLRTKLKIVEKNLTNKDYSSISYENVPSKAMLKYHKVFLSKDEERFSTYLEEVKNGKSKINAKVLAPYEIIKAAMNENLNKSVTDELWENLDDYFDGKNKNVLIVADTSGSMEAFNYLPMASSVGLAIYAAERNTGIFHNKFINFSDNPTFQVLYGNKLSELLNSIDYSNWGASTNIDAAIKMILNATKNVKEDCPSHLVIISDMEFDSCTDGKTNFQHWKDKYQEFGLTMPKIVFWNVAGCSNGVPITKNEQDVIMVSGFSHTIFKRIFDIENYNPTDAMIEILKPYLSIVVNDSTKEL